MSANYRPADEIQIAGEFYEKINSFIQDNKEWWSVASKWQGSRYGVAITNSLKCARDLMEKGSGHAEVLEAFRQAVDYVISSCITQDNASIMTSKIITTAGENNEFILSVAQDTRDKLQKIVRNPAENSERPDGFVFFDSKTIQTLQQNLSELGYFKGEISGEFDTETSTALRNYQIQNKLQVTGELDDEIIGKINKDLISYQNEGKPENEENVVYGPEGMDEKVAGKPEKYIVNHYLPYLATEGNYSETEDRLDFTYDIRSLATVISLTDINPPLAIGLFGNWGTGKSFFMEKLSQQVEAYARTGAEGFVNNVVQVKFNSWHYSDSNLWASLTTEIFDSLNAYATRLNKEDELKKLSETLSTASNQLQETERKRNDLSEKIEKLKLEKKEQRKRLEDISGIKIFELLLSDTRVQGDLKLFENHNIEAILQDKEKLSGYLNNLQDWKKQFAFFRKTLGEMKGKRWRSVLIIALLIFAGAVSVRYYFPEWWNAITAWVVSVSATLTAVVGNVIRLLQPVKRDIDATVGRLRSLKDTFDNRPETDLADIQEMDNEIKMLTRSINSLDKEIQTAQKEYDDLKNGRKLLEFIGERSRDELYSKQLGLISWIRKDFLKLDELLRKQHILTEEEKKINPINNPHEVQLQIDRIVLYIDDLDRCNEDTVIKVLEAIHLLLALPLFVVVVGVDPRWLNNALSEKYKNLFGAHYASESAVNQDDIAKTALSGAATSYDYLEKIFQIPFSLRQINSTGRKNLIKYLLRNEMQPEPVVPEVEQTTEKPTETETENLNASPPDKFIALPKNVIAEEDKVPEIIEEHKERLTFLKEEMECMQQMSVLFGQSPRTINRFINIYRIIKAHGKLKVSDEFSENDYAPIMLVLSIIVGFSTEAQDFINKLSKFDDNAQFIEFLTGQGYPQTFVDQILASMKPSVDELPVKAFKDNLELISRFSFRTFAVSVEKNTGE